MKVAVVTSFPQDPGSPIGGVEAVSVNLVRALARLEDLEVHVVTLDNSLGQNQITLWERATVHRLACKTQSVLINAVTTGRRLIKDYLSVLNPDVVHSHDTYGLMVKGLHVPRVFTVHGFIHGDTLVSGVKLPRLRAALWKWVETKGWADQPHIISISPYVRERLCGIVKSNIHDIENPVSESFFAIDRCETPGVIFCAAVISPRKNTLALIDAFEILVRQGIDCQLRLAGKIAEPRYGRLVEERLRTGFLKDRVHLLGGISSEQVGRELAGAAVFALTSLEENAPLGIEEAMAARVPVVVSNRCGMPYMVRHAETGFLVDPHRPEDIAYRLAMLLKDGELRKKMGERSRAIALECFHPARVAYRTREVYRDAQRTALHRK